ncbi:MAG: hypothetical protein AUJ75_00950 [Candidatus Omnitrophica bacterium CG1_02_49_10]|nr:MAG: hypothetical protein AUJ75_00950 [Candidatus Omnitrophica bacterium CG1_02_49_10]
MNIPQILYILTVPFGGLALGYIFKLKGYLQGEWPNHIMRYVVMFISPVIMCISFWKLHIPNIKILTLPLVGLSVTLLSIPPAIFISSKYKLTRRQKGSVVTTAMFSNIGYTMGGFLAFVLLGEKAFNLTILYILYYSPFFYIVGFYMAERYGLSGKNLIGEIIRKTFTQGIRLMPLLGLFIGGILSLSGVERPAIFYRINSILVPAATFAILFAAGLNLRLSKIPQRLGICLWMSFIKFVYSPALALLLAYLLGYGAIDGGLPLKVVFIESSMPVAVSSLMLPSMFNLDQDISNFVWLFTTILLIPIIPVIALILRAL